MKLTEAQRWNLDVIHFPSVVYKRCTACGWEIVTKAKTP